jgi:inner membrane protein
MPSPQCPNLYGEEPQESHAEFTIFSETNGDLKLLRELKASNCFLEAWLRFARIPLVTAELATDLRFRSRVNRADFSALKFDDFTGQQCPPSVPAWDFPRADLLLPKNN